MTSIAKIVSAKLKDKSKLPYWYQQRLYACSTCPFNSSNKEELSLREKAWKAANLGKDICVICGCAIEDKASEKTEVCSLQKLNKAPLWNAIKEEIMSGNISVVNKSEDVGALSLRKENEVLFTYNSLRYKDASDITLIIKANIGKLTDFQISSSCGCTTPAVVNSNGEGIVKISYDTKRFGEFLKTVSVSYKEGTVKRKTIIKIKGNVKN